MTTKYRSFIYVLLLEGDRYYVGQTINLTLRMWQHFTHSNSLGSSWTALYKPISVVHCSEVIGSKEEHNRIEKICTLRLAKLKGMDVVRGGAFTNSSALIPAGWAKAVALEEPADITRFIPIDSRSLKNIIDSVITAKMVARMLRQASIGKSKLRTVNALNAETMQGNNKYYFFIDEFEFAIEFKWNVPFICFVKGPNGEVDDQGATGNPWHLLEPLDVENIFEMFRDRSFVV